MNRKIQIALICTAFLLIGGILIKLVFDKIFAGPEEIEPEFVLCYGEVNSEGHIMSDTAYYFAECVKELSEGKVIVEIYPAGQLGDDTQCYKAMQMGSLDLYRGNSSSLTGDTVPMVSMMALPYMFYDTEHFWNVCDSKLGEQILDDIQESFGGVKGLAFLDEGARNFFTTDTPITKLSDIEGLSFRVQNSDIMVDTVSALGATAVPIEYVELYSSLEGKSVDGAENPPISYYYNKFYEVAPYYVKDAHTYSPAIILISEITWEKLGEGYQAVVQEAAKMAQKYNKDKIQAQEELVYEMLEQNGATITELEDPTAWRAAMEPVYEKYGSQYKELIWQMKNMR